MERIICNSLTILYIALDLQRNDPLFLLDALIRFTFCQTKEIQLNRPDKLLFTEYKYYNQWFVCFSLFYLSPISLLLVLVDRDLNRNI